MSAIDILMPALSPTMEDGALTRWLVKVGDTIRAGDVLAEIETDKATMEVEAVDEGEVTHLFVEAGSQGVKVATPIARLNGHGSAAPTAPAVSPPPEPMLAIKAPLPAAPPVARSKRVFASPLARRLAAQAGIDLATLMGSGPHGRIVRRDVDGAAIKAAPAANDAARPVRTLADMGIPDGSYDLVPLDGMRKAIARRMVESFRDVPHFPLTVDCEIDRLLGARAHINALLEPQGVKVSVNDFVIKAAAMALKAVPAANASYTPDGLALHHHADIAVAVAVEGGLITPIIRKAETLSLSQIAVAARDLAARARERKLQPAEFQGGTFSISNLGMFGVRAFASILNEPQGAILSVGAGEQRPVVKDGALAVATVMTVTLTCDHRVVDGAIGAAFLQAFRARIEEPLGLLI